MPVLLIDVDDLIITGNGKEEIQAICKDLSFRFEMNELGGDRTLHLEVDFGPKGLFLYRKKYVSDVLKQFGMTNSS